MSYAIEQEVVCLTCSLAQQQVVVVVDIEQHEGHHIKAMGKVMPEPEPQ